MRQAFHAPVSRNPSRALDGSGTPGAFPALLDYDEDPFTNDKLDFGADTFTAPSMLPRE
jgi:hypothetical protein